MPRQILPRTRQIWRARRLPRSAPAFVQTKCRRTQTRKGAAIEHASEQPSIAANASAARRELSKGDRMDIFVLGAQQLHEQLEPSPAYT